MDFFKHVEAAPPDPIFGLLQAYHADPRPTKVNLAIGSYKTNELKPLILKCVKEAERALFESETSKDYLPIDGDPHFVKLVKELVLGSDGAHVYGAQNVGGTGALRTAAIFLKEHVSPTIALSAPTWANHQRIFTHTGLQLTTYPYYKDNEFAFDEMCVALEALPPKTLCLLHGCCHNPSGFDPSLEQWKELSALMQKRQLFPFFDLAYQGFGEDVESDVAGLRHFAEQGTPCALAISFSKNFGLYAERTGALLFVCEGEEEAKRVGSKVKSVIRGLYSNPPCHGERIVSKILEEPERRAQWEKELAAMRNRILEMRHALLTTLQQRTSHPFDFLGMQRGMFAYTGLAKDCVLRLTKEFGVYLPQDGRLNVAGLNSSNLDYVADAIATVLT